MRKKCKNCDKNCENGDLCFRCKPRSPLPKIRKTFEKTVTDAINNISTMQMFFLSIWQKRAHKSEISGEWLPQDIDGFPSSSAYFHHILEKEKFPEAKYDKENIILLTLEEHDNVHIDMYKYEEINKRRELLKIKYNL
jgi:hypothetical protein